MKIIIFGSNSDFIKAAIPYLIEQNHELICLQRKNKDNSENVTHIKFDILKDSFEKLIKKNSRLFENWDLLIIAVGDLKPVGKFKDTKINNIMHSINLNLLKQIELIHFFININKNRTKTILTFAGSGTNGVANNYLSYALSKVALIKFTELLASEEKKIRLVSLGIGWFKSKLHNATLRNRLKSGKNYRNTILNIKKVNNSEKIKLFIKFLDWIRKTNPKNFNGKNFSLVDDTKIYINKDIPFKLNESSYFKLRTRK